MCCDAEITRRITCGSRQRPISPRFSLRAARLEDSRVGHANAAEATRAIAALRPTFISPRVQGAAPLENPRCAGALEVSRRDAACRHRRTIADSTYAGGRR